MYQLLNERDQSFDWEEAECNQLINEAYYQNSEKDLNFILFS